MDCEATNNVYRTDSLHQIEKFFFIQWWGLSCNRAHCYSNVTFNLSQIAVETFYTV